MNRRPEPIIPNRKRPEPIIPNRKGPPGNERYNDIPNDEDHEKVRYRDAIQEPNKLFRKKGDRTGRIRFKFMLYRTGYNKTPVANLIRGRTTRDNQ